MPVEIRYESGTSEYALPDESISSLSFGARYVSYDGVDRFVDQSNDLNLGMIVWPGGTLAEGRDDRFGFEFDRLYDPATGKPDIADMMAIAVEQGTGLSVVLPTARYADDLETLREEMQDFLGDLLGGAFGPLPEPMILEIGSEYFANFDGADRASDYGAVADLMVTEIAWALADPSVNTTGADVTIAVQAGKTLADDIAIRDELSNEALAHVDMIVHHRFAYQPQGIDARIDELHQIVEAWGQDATGAGGVDPELFVSAWNTVTLTRNEALTDYIAEEASQGIHVDRSDVDLDGRTTTDFERFWQDRLDEAAYGQEHAAYILESFASYAEAGMDAGAVYGIDTVHPGHLSWREDGEDYSFAGAEMLKMIYESVGGTHVLRSDGPYDPNDPVTLYGFENDDKLVLFVAAGDHAPGNVTIELDGLGTEYRSVWAEKLTSETPEDWMAVFGIADNPQVDESAEAQAYALGVRDVVTPGVRPGAIEVSLTGEHDIIRLSFGKTDAGAAEIAGWSGGEGTELHASAPLPVTDPGSLPVYDDDDDDFHAFLAGAGGGGGGIGLMLAMLFFFL
ncbi:hypothetical protein C8D95_103339 [Silicimonas algicola]|uniref:Uncharacterized protein n=1 Tax=Silicimonas algicola TaxID=1826607 RepID=A0A316G813_9RHOB|nr:hypothetical protein C8D95_103339 [Silicimonas algicola]